MRILAFTPFSSMFGGANRSFFMVLRALKNKYGHDIKVIVPEKDVLCDELDRIGIKWELFPFKKIRGVYGKSLTNYLRLFRLYWYSIVNQKIAKKVVNSLDESFDIVYLNDCDSILGALVASKLNIPYVWHFRSLIKPNIIFPYSVKKAYRNCARIIAISNGMKDLLEHNNLIPKGIVTMVYNGIPVSDIPRALAYDGCVLHLLICGRLTEEKGHKDALRAISYLREWKDDRICLHIVGSALSAASKIYEAELKELVKEFGISNQIVFEGQIDDMPLFRSKMHVELMCSSCEPFGRVTVEGMRSGLVVIGSNTGGTPEIITDGETGLLYQQGDARDLALKIHSVYKDIDFYQKLSDAGYLFGMTHFTEEENVKNVNNILMSTIQR